MDSTTTLFTNIFSLSKTTSYYSTSPLIQSHRTQLHVRRGAKAQFRIRNRLACLSNNSGGGGAGGGGGGEGGGGGGEMKGDRIVVGVDNNNNNNDDGFDDVIVLDVEGMTCGGCSGKVKRILESQPLVSAASVNHQTKTAIVWPVPEAKVTPNWQTVLGEQLAKHLTTCGFISNLRGEAATEGEAS